MHLLLLTSELPPEHSGGIARYAENMARVMAVQGHSVTIIVRTDQPDTIAPITEIPGVRVVPMLPGYTKRHMLATTQHPDQHPSYPYNVIGDWPGVSYQMAQSVLDVIQNGPVPDVIETQEFGALPYYVLQRKLTERGPLEHIPILVHRHTALYETMQINQEPRYRFPEYWVGQMEKFCIRAADALLSPSHFLTEQTRQTVGATPEIATIPYPMLLEDRDSASVAETILPGDIVYVGRLELRKGILQTIAACESLWKRGAQFRLTLIGGDTLFRPRGMMMSAYLRQRYGHWIASGLLMLPGPLAHADVQQRLRSAWAVLVPSLWENFPNSCIEAMNAGQVVLASQRGGQAEMIGNPQEMNGFLFDWDIPGDFERQLEHILSLSITERVAIGIRASQRIRKMCDPQHILAQRIRHFEQLIERHELRRVFPSALDIQLPAALPVVEADQQRGLLSVVIPFYNLGEYIQETVVSVLRSGYRPIEMVVVDDGSTDVASIARLRELADRHAELRVVCIPNGGLANARNVGADAARGEFLAFLDADDMVEPEFYSRAIDVLMRYDNVAFVYSWVRWFGLTDQIWPTWNTEFPYLLGHNMLAPIVVMSRVHFLQAARNKPVAAYNFEDYESWMSLVEAGGIGVSLPHPLVLYRVRDGSMYRLSNRDQQLYLFELLSKLHPELYQHWGAELFHLQNANGPAFLWSHPAALSAQHAQEHLLEQLRTAEAQGVLLSDMVRGGRFLAWMRQSWLFQLVRKLGVIRLMRQIAKRMV